MLNLIKLELMKMFHKKRTYLGFIGLVGIPILIGVGMKYGTKFEGVDINYMRAMLNGYVLIAFATFVGMPFFAPLFVSLVSGDMIAGESGAGTLRTILVRPVGRGKLLLSKFITALIYTAILMALMDSACLLAGKILFGFNASILNILLSRSQPEFLGPIAALPQSIKSVQLGFLFAVLSLSVIVSLAILISVLTDNSLGATAGTIVIFLISSSLSYYDKVKPYLFTTYLDVWQKMFRNPIPWSNVYKSLAILSAYELGFLILALIIFRRKDILC